MRGQNITSRFMGQKLSTCGPMALDHLNLCLTDSNGFTVSNQAGRGLVKNMFGRHQQIMFDRNKVVTSYVLRSGTC